MSLRILAAAGPGEVRVAVVKEAELLDTRFGVRVRPTGLGTFIGVG